MIFKSSFRLAYFVRILGSGKKELNLYHVCFNRRANFLGAEIKL